MIQLNVTARDPQGQPIDGAIVTLFTYDAAGKPAPFEPAIRTWANFYSSDQPYAPAGFHPPFMVYGTATAPGYQTSYIQSTTWDGKSSLDISIVLALFKRPFTPAPRVWTGQMCGLRVPGLPPVAGGAADPSLFLSWFYDRYAQGVRDGLLRPAMKGRGYLDTLLSWPDSRSVGATPASFLATCRELLADGLRPAVMLCSKDHDPPDVPSILANIAPVLPSLVGVVPRFCIGWELSLWLTPTDVQTLIDALAPVWLKQAGTLGYVHFQEGYFSFPQPGQNNASFWRLQVGKLTGVLYQRRLDDSQALYQAHLADCTTRCAGNFGMPLDSGFGHPFDTVAFEITAQPQFNGQMTEAEGDSWGRCALATPVQHGPAGDVRVMGSGNGQ